MLRDEVSALDEATKHYGSLFTIPKYSSALLLLLSVTIFGGLVSFWLFTPTMTGVYQGLIFGFSVMALPSIVNDFVIRRAIIYGDKLFILRRCAVTTLSGCLVWIIIFIVGAILSRVFGQTSLLTLSYFYGGCIALSVRYLIFRALSSLSTFRVVCTAASQPAICLLISCVQLHPTTQLLLSTALAGTFLLALTHLFISSIDEFGKRNIGIGAIQLFRAFVLDWAESLPQSLEKHFEKMGRQEDISLTALAFRGEGIPRAHLTVPVLHPGPFRDVGSSELPFLVQKALENKFNVVAAVPHGTSGHEFDLTSQEQSKRVVDEILNLFDLQHFSPRTTRLIRTENSLAKATCQMFDSCAFVTITCAPRGIEDIPREVGLQIVSDGVAMGAGTVVVVDAHNSITSTTQLPLFTEVDALSVREAAVEAISKALREPYKDFTIGVSKVVPPEFDLKQGMGPGGIVSLVVGVGGQTVAYVTIDGNNMITNLRDRILESLRKSGIDDGEVLTTDTHMVNGVTLTRRGYRPIGEAMDEKRLISYIDRSVAQARSNMKQGEVAFKAGVARGVMIIGGGIVKLSLLVDSAMKYTKRLAVVIVTVGITVSLLLFRLFV